MIHGIESPVSSNNQKVAAQPGDEDLLQSPSVQNRSSRTPTRQHHSFRQRHASDALLEKKRTTRRSSVFGDARRQRQLSLEPVVSAARVDPFNSWPIAWHRDLAENFRFLVHSFGPLTFGYVQNDQGFDIFQSEAQLALRDPAAFHSLMIMATIKKGQLSGQMLPGMNALWHRVEALRMIKERIDGGDIAHCTTEGSIYAVMVLMGIGNLWHAVDQGEFDSSALNRLVSLKGGLNVISKSHPVLETSIFGMAVISPELLRTDLYAVNDLSVLDQTQDNKVLLYSLLGFLRGVSNCAEKMPVTLSRVQQMFSPGRPSRSLLTQAPDHPEFPTDEQQILQQRLRKHVVLYVFSVLLWASPFQVEQFMNHLQYILNHAHIWQNSLRMFAWALVADVPKSSLMFSKQAWQSYEMLCAVNCLDRQLQDDILGLCREILFGRNDMTKYGNELMSRIQQVMFKPQTAVGS